MRSGATLLELVIVMGLIIIMASLAIPMITIVDRSLVRYELDGLYLALRALQHTAQLTSSPQSILFDTEHQAYMVNGITHKLSSSVCFGSPPGILGPPATPTHTIQHPITFPGHKVVCHSDGIISSGTIYLTDTHHRYAFAITCPVSQVSFIRRYAYNGKWVAL